MSLARLLGGSCSLLLAITCYAYIYALLEKRDALLMDSGMEMSDKLLFDERFYFTPEAVHKYLTQIGPQGRSLYIEFYKYDGVCFPCLYGMVLAFGIEYCYGWKYVVLPVLTSLLDITENCLVQYLLHTYPVRHSEVEFALGKVTCMKWSTGLISVALVAYVWLRNYIAPTKAKVV